MRCFIFLLAVLLFRPASVSCQEINTGLGIQTNFPLTNELGGGGGIPGFPAIRGEINWMSASGYGFPVACQIGAGAMFYIPTQQNLVVAGRKNGWDHEFTARQKTTGWNMRIRAAYEIPQEANPLIMYHFGFGFGFQGVKKLVQLEDFNPAKDDIFSSSVESDGTYVDKYFGLGGEIYIGGVYEMERIRLLGQLHVSGLPIVAGFTVGVLVPIKKF